MKIKKVKITGHPCLVRLWMIVEIRHKLEWVVGVLKWAKTYKHPDEYTSETLYVGHLFKI